MISKFTTEIPNEVETLARWTLNFAVQTTDDKLSSLHGSNGDIIAEFDAGSPRKTETGKVILTQGNNVPVLTITAATIEIERGPDAGPYKTIGSIVVSGVDVDGRAWQGHSTGPAGETSLGFEMATSDKPNENAQAAELKKWAKE